MKVSVILPTYNEKGNIGSLLEQLVSTLEGIAIEDFELLVIDDNSSDGTSQAVGEIMKSEKRVRLTVRENEKGLASAVKAGIELSRGEIIVLMDTDFNHNPKDVERLVTPIGEYDIIVGSRYIKGGFMESSWIRHYLSYFFNLFIRYYLGLETMDNLSGFIAVKREITKDMDLHLIFDGFGEYHIRFIYWSLLKGYNVLEIPVIYNERSYGKSKFKPIENLINYTKTVLRTKKDITL